jgi:hypothetical protein
VRKRVIHLENVSQPAKKTLIESAKSWQIKRKSRKKKKKNNEEECYVRKNNEEECRRIMRKK